MDREILQINCIPGTEYVIYGFLDTNDFPNNIFIARVTSKPLPRNMNATVQAEWQLYDGTALETLYQIFTKGQATIGYLSSRLPRQALKQSIHGAFCMSHDQHN